MTERQPHTVPQARKNARPTRPSASSRWLEVAVGSQRLGLPLSQVREILVDIHVDSGPQNHGTTDGLIYLRGHVVPILDLGRVLEGPQSNGQQLRTVVIVEAGAPHSAQWVIGVAVDAVGEVFSMETAIDGPPPVLTGAQPPSVSDAGSENDHPVLVDLRRLIPYVRD